MEKRNKAALTVLLLFSAVLLLWSIFPVSRRVALEIKHKTADLAVSYSDIRTLSKYLKKGTRETLAVCRANGASSVILTPSEMREGLKEVKSAGLEPIFKADRQKQDNLADFPAGARILFVNNEVFDAGIAVARDLKVCLMEFYRPAGYEGINKKNILTLHTLKDRETYSLSTEKLKKTFLSAWSERKTGILYVKLKFNTPDPAAENSLLLKGISGGLKEEGAILGVFKENPYILGGSNNIKAVKAAALLAALLLPTAGFYLAFKINAPVLVRFVVMSACSLFAGLIISGLLADTVFMLKLEEFRGVKLALTLPVLAVFLGLCRSEKSVFAGKMLRYALPAGALLAGLFLVASLRSGNLNVPLFPFEEPAREFLEKVFWARPRSKEFLIGHPLMLLGLYMFFNKRYEKYKASAILALSAGMFGQVSLVNTFCHAHIPFLMSLVRAVYGLALGALGGALLILCLKHLKKS